MFHPLFPHPAGVVTDGLFAGGVGIGICFTGLLVLDFFVGGRGRGADGNVDVVVQSVGLILAAGGGLNIGREGPYTHLGGMVSYQLIEKVPFFRAILKQETVLRQVSNVFFVGGGGEGGEVEAGFEEEWRGI